jgi:hypothetical protein
LISQSRGLGDVYKRQLPSMGRTKFKYPLQGNSFLMRIPITIPITMHGF